MPFPQDKMGNTSGLLLHKKLVDPTRTPVCGENPGPFVNDKSSGRNGLMLNKHRGRRSHIPSRLFSHIKHRGGRNVFLLYEIFHSLKSLLVDGKKNRIMGGLFNQALGDEPLRVGNIIFPDHQIRHPFGVGVEYYVFQPTNPAIQTFNMGFQPYIHTFPPIIHFLNFSKKVLRNRGFVSRQL